MYIYLQIVYIRIIDYTNINICNIINTRKLQNFIKYIQKRA